VRGQMPDLGAKVRGNSALSREKALREIDCLPRSDQTERPGALAHTGPLNGQLAVGAIAANICEFYTALLQRALVSSGSANHLRADAFLVPGVKNEVKTMSQAVRIHVPDDERPRVAMCGDGSHAVAGGVGDSVSSRLVSSGLYRPVNVPNMSSEAGRGRGAEYIAITVKTECSDDNRVQCTRFGVRTDIAVSVTAFEHTVCVIRLGLGGPCCRPDQCDRHSSRHPRKFHATSPFVRPRRLCRL
jgi:hypothetical protein